MTKYFLYSGGDGSSGSTDWATAYNSLPTALAGITGAGPHTLLVDNAFAETMGAALDLNATTAGQVLRIISVARSGTSGYTAYSKGAAFTAAAGTAVNVATARAQTLTLFGLVITGSSTGSAANLFNAATGAFNASVTFEDCTISCPGTASQARITIGSAATSGTKTQSVRIRNTALITKQSTTSAAFNIRSCRLEMSNVTHAFAGANKSPTLFGFTAECLFDVRITDSDLSGFDAGNYFDIAALDGTVQVTNCKRHGTPGLTTGTFPTGFGSIVAVNVSATDTVGDYYFANLYGTIIHETTYVAANGAKVNTTLTSWKITTSASCTEDTPFITPWINTWGTETSAINPDMEMLWNSATPATDRDIHPEFEYVSSSSFSQGSFLSISNIAPYDGTANNWNTAGDTWAGSLSPSDSRTIRVPNPTSPGSTLTPAEKSVLRMRLHVGVASLTGLYVSPCMYITGRSNNPPVYWMSNGEVWQEPVASAGVASGGFVIGS